MSPKGASMPDVVEVRVHGVGGTPPHDLLGEPSPADVLRVGGEASSAFFTRLRGGERVEGYAWGPLTSSGLMQPLWIFLLPFTLVNVAGWTLPSPSEAWSRRRSRRAGELAWRAAAFLGGSAAIALFAEGRLRIVLAAVLLVSVLAMIALGAWRTARLIIALIALGLTLSYVFGLSVLVIRQLFYQWRLSGIVEDAGTAVWLGTATIVVIGALVFLVALRKQSQFEKVVPLLDPTPMGGARSAARQAFERIFARDERLDEQGFWSSPGAATALLTVHLVAAAGALAWLTRDALTAAELGLPRPEWRQEFVLLGGSLTLALAALFLVLLLGFRNPLRLFVTRSFRVFAPIVATTTGIGLGTGFFVGSALLLDRALGLSGLLELDLGLAFGAASLSAVLAAAAVGAHLLGRSFREARRIRETGSPPPDTAPPGREPNGLPGPMVMRVALTRALSEFGRNADLVLTVPAVVYSVIVLTPGPAIDAVDDAPAFLPVSAAVVAVSLLAAFMSARPFEGRRATAPLLMLFAAAAVIVFAGWRLRDAIALSTLGPLGAGVAILSTGAFLAFWVRGYFKPEQRRVIAIVWDVLTFFPRRFHPLAVRPYSERAVPELIGRLLWHLIADRRVILSAHSQGTVIALAVLSRVAAAEEDAPSPKLRQVALATYGSPLSQLHARFFPGLFSPEAFEALAQRLHPGTVTRNGEEAPIGWRNFYRETDYIGKRVDIGSGPRNEVVPDPPETSTDSPPQPAHPDLSRTPWVVLNLHSHYNTDVALKEWIRELRANL